MKVYLPFLLPFILYSCASTSRVDISAEPAPAPLVAEGEATYTRYKTKWPTVKNVQVERVAKRLKAVLPETLGGWDFATFNFSIPNALALPGGNIGINTGILPIAKTDAGIATVLSHEIAHVLKNHHFEKNLRINADKILSNLTYESEEQKLQGETFKQELLKDLPDTKMIELEADQVGLIYMAKAGYDPREALAFWERFITFKKANNLTALASHSSHPLDSQRIEALNEVLPIALKEYRKSQ